MLMRARVRAFQPLAGAAGQSVDTFLEVPGAHPPVGVSLVGSPTNAL